MSAQLQHVLCVDDEEDILEIAKICLESVGGFKVSCCGTGRQALAQAESIAPDLILLDVMMPDMDGPTVLKGLREKPGLANVPVIFMTARVQPAEINAYLEAGAAGVIAKPFDPVALSGELEKHWKTFHKKK